jgi:hypothetical protein
VTTPDKFLADTAALLKIQQESGRRIIRLRISATFWPQGTTVAESSWPKPKAPKKTDHKRIGGIPR